MLRRVLPFLFVIFSLVLDMSVLPFLSSSELLPLIGLCSVIALGLLLGRTRGTLLGLIGGTLVDALVGTPIGLMMVLYTACGYIAGVAGRKFQRYILAPVVAPIVCFALVESTMFAYDYLAGVQLTGELLGEAGLRVLIEVVLVQILYLIYNRVLKPRWSRYAAG